MGMNIQKKILINIQEQNTENAGYVLEKGQENMKMLCWTDDPVGATGYSRQARNILTRFRQQGFEIACLGINRMDESPHEPFEDDRPSFKIFRANIQGDPKDQEGRGLLQAIFPKLTPDILFIPKQAI